MEDTSRTLQLPAFGLCALGFFIWWLLYFAWGMTHHTCSGEDCLGEGIKLVAYPLFLSFVGLVFGIISIRKRERAIDDIGIEHICKSCPQHLLDMVDRARKANRQDILMPYRQIFSL